MINEHVNNYDHLTIVLDLCPSLQHAFICFFSSFIYFRFSRTVPSLRPSSTGSLLQPHLFFKKQRWEIIWLNFGSLHHPLSLPTFSPKKLTTSLFCSPPTPTFPSLRPFALPRVVSLQLATLALTTQRPGRLSLTEDCPIPWWVDCVRSAGTPR